LKKNQFSAAGLCSGKHNWLLKRAARMNALFTRGKSDRAEKLSTFGAAERIRDTFLFFY